MNQVLRKLMISFFSLAILLLICLAGVGYWAIFKDNVIDPSGEIQEHELFIKTGWGYDQVKNALKEQGIIRNDLTFDWVARKMNYPQKVFAGRYLINKDMGNRELVSLLRSGKQTPYNLAIHNIRTKGDLVSLVSQKLEADSVELYQLLSDSIFLAKHNFTPENVISIFIANTYQFNWNTSANDFFERMKREYHNFWTEERKQKAKNHKLTPFQAITLASIVEEETAKNDEMSRIAGVYYNRLEAFMPLQADPTVKFAVGDFTLKRILTEHLAIDSPYNTYKNIGLPPGPIRIPSLLALESVLQPEAHNFIYFCAKEDFSGYHNFASTYEEHLINARKYRDELNRRQIR